MKLKTLKDLKRKAIGIEKEFFPIFEEKLKAEAIKWVKDDKRRIKLGNINLQILLTRWMVRLNLTGEDLI